MGTADLPWLPGHRRRSMRATSPGKLPARLPRAPRLQARRSLSWVYASADLCRDWFAAAPHPASRCRKHGRAEAAGRRSDESVETWLRGASARGCGSEAHLPEDQRPPHSQSITADFPGARRSPCCPLSRSYAPIRAVGARRHLQRQGTRARMVNDMNELSRLVSTATRSRVLPFRRRRSRRARGDARTCRLHRVRQEFASRRATRTQLASFAPPTRAGFRYQRRSGARCANDRWPSTLQALAPVSAAVVA